MNKTFFLGLYFFLGSHLSGHALEQQNQTTSESYQPSYVVLTAFPPEWEAWTKKSKYSYKEISVRGLTKPMLCSEQSVCVVYTGEGEVNAAVSVTSLLLSTRLNINKTIFIRSGTAGGVLKNSSPIGTVYINSWVVSWGLGRHYLDQNKQLAWTPPKGWNNLNQSSVPPENVVYEINPILLRDAFEIASPIKLKTTPASKQQSALYKLTQDPKVMAGVTITSNNYWSGYEQQNIAEKIVETYTKGQGIYTNSAMEDIGDLDALNRFGLASNYLSIRAISDIDVETTDMGTKLANVNLAGIADFTDLAVSNAMTVTETILNNWIRSPNKK